MLRSEGRVDSSEASRVASGVWPAPGRRVEWRRKMRYVRARYRECGGARGERRRDKRGSGFKSAMRRTD